MADESMEAYNIVNEATRDNIKLRALFGKSCIDYVISVLKDYKKEAVDEEFERVFRYASEINLNYREDIIPVAPPKKLKGFAGDYVFELYKQRRRA